MNTRVTYCANQMRKSGQGTADERGNKYIFCSLDKEICIAQRFCPEQKKYIISEKAKGICRDYKG